MKGVPGLPGTPSSVFSRFTTTVKFTCNYIVAMLKLLRLLKKSIRFNRHYLFLLAAASRSPWRLFVCCGADLLALIDALRLSAIYNSVNRSQLRFRILCVARKSHGMRVACVHSSRVDSASSASLFSRGVPQLNGVLVDMRSICVAL